MPWGLSTDTPINKDPPGTIGVRILAASQVYIEQSVIFGFKTGTGRGVSDKRTTGARSS